VTTALRYRAPATSRFDGFTIEARAQGPQEAPDPYLSAAYSVYQPADFTQIDAYAGYRLATSLLLEVRGYNLGNDRYALYAGYPMPGRSVQVELRSR
jgi:outer membrane receptor protein involved in Fe transport